MNLKWSKNLDTAIPNGAAGVCPYCGSVDTHMSVSVGDDVDKHFSTVIWCDDCKRAFDANGRHTTLPPQEGIPIPQGLRY
jgi:hypothetical protein